MTIIKFKYLIVAMMFAVTSVQSSTIIGNKESCRSLSQDSYRMAQIRDQGVSFKEYEPTLFVWLTNELKNKDSYVRDIDDLSSVLLLAMHVMMDSSDTPARVATSVFRQCMANKGIN